MDFRVLGLSDYETKAYAGLLRLGKSGASAISRESGVSYGKIYEVLASLERKGLLKVVPEKTKQFVPSAPNELIDIITQREKELTDLKKSVEDLKALYEQHNQTPVEIAQGKRNFYKVLRDMTPNSHIQYNIKYMSEYQPEWERDERENIRRGGDIKVLSRYDDETRENVKRQHEIHPNHRIFPNDGVAMSIRDTQVMITLIKRNTIMLVNDSMFADIMRRLFLAAYEKSPPVQKP
jgi:sugar-specific transcriptional regulator TrmB